MLALWLYTSALAAPLSTVAIVTDAPVGASIAGAPIPDSPSAAVVDGERLEWAITWRGIHAGSAWSTTTANAASWVFEAGARSAKWLKAMYSIDDLLHSEWTPGVGSTRYVARFREGRFEQDQDVHFREDAVVASRTQRFKDGLRTWEKRYRAVPTVEDPVAAFYRLRAEAGPVGERVRYKVWTGRKAIPMVVWTAGVEDYDGQSAFRVEVLTDHGNEDVETKMTVWITDDAERVPLAALVRTSAGPVRATLVKRILP